MKSGSCECCLMPFSKDPKDSGSDKYCSYCFENGKLRADGQSLAEFQRRSYEGMRTGGLNPVMAWVFSRMIRFAPYWKGRR